MKPSVYIETSIVSYLRKQPNSQVTMAARQFLTDKFWHEHRDEYDLVTSRYVLDEAARGDPVLAAERLLTLQTVPVLPLDTEIPVIANEIVSRAILPPQAKLDALHIGMAAYHEVQYLLTWNCRHIANARILPRIHEVLKDMGHFVPLICTPEEMIAYDPEDD